MNRIHRTLASLSFVLVASASQAITFGGVTVYWFTQGNGSLTSANVNGYTYDTSTNAGAVFTEDHTTTLGRADGFASTQFHLMFSFSTGNIPVEVSNLRLTQNGKLVNGGGNAQTPYSYTGAAGYIFEYDDANNDNLYTWGEGTYYTPFVAGGYYHTSVTGNGLQTFNLDTTDARSYVLAANRKYAMYFLTDDDMTLTNIGGAPTAAVTVENFEASISMDYQAVPEPGTMAALGLGALAVARKRRRK